MHFCLGPLRVNLKAVFILTDSAESDEMPLFIWVFAVFPCTVYRFTVKIGLIISNLALILFCKKCSQSKDKTQEK